MTNRTLAEKDGFELLSDTPYRIVKVNALPRVKIAVRRTVAFVIPHPNITGMWCISDTPNIQEGGKPYFSPEIAFDEFVDTWNAKEQERMNRRRKD